MNIKTFGETIKHLRKRKDLTILQLSALSGIPFNTLGRIERGENWPSTQWLEKLSGALEVPVSAFFQEEGNLKPMVHLRGEKGLPEKVKKEAESIIDGYSRLEDLCKAKKYQAFPLDIPLFEYNEAEIEEASIQCREIMGIRDAIVFDLINLFESNGLRVITCRFPKEIHGFSFWSPKHKGVYFFLNAADTTERKIFTLVHELGHLIFHQGGTKYFVYQPLASKDIVEQASQYFAACFLMPEKSIRKTIQQLGIHRDLWDLELLLNVKRRFSVSAEAFTLRLFELELISKKQRDELKEMLHNYYDRHDFKEPSPASIGLSENQRLKDLLLIASKKDGTSREWKDLELKLRGLGVVL